MEQCGLERTLKTTHFHPLPTPSIIPGCSNLIQTDLENFQGRGIYKISGENYLPKSKYFTGSEIVVQNWKKRH